MDYPITYDADYAPVRNRTTVFLRALTQIPVFLMLYVYSIAAGGAVLLAWFSLVFTSRYPAGLYRFVTGYTRFAARALAYSAVLTDVYPPFNGDADDNYPVRVHFAAPLEHYSRAKAGFRLVIAIPVLLLRYVMQMLLFLGAFFAWCAIVFTGKLPRGLFDLMVLAQSYMVRSDAYLYLLTEIYPPFQDAQTRSAGVPSAA